MKERNVLVAAALKKHDRWVARRCSFILAAFLLAAIGVGALDESLPRPDWVDLAALISFGLFFYCYLLWEINGPIPAAVSKFTGESGAADLFGQS